MNSLLCFLLLLNYLTDVNVRSVFQVTKIQDGVVAVTPLGLPRFPRNFYLYSPHLSILRATFNNALPLTTFPVGTGFYLASLSICAIYWYSLYRLGHQYQLFILFFLYLNVRLNFYSTNLLNSYNLTLSTHTLT